MVEGAARLVDHILPTVPVRQWVLSLPTPLRFVLAYDAALCSHVLSLFLREVFRWQRWTAKQELGLASVSDAHAGAFTAIHRAGSSLNLNLHYHSGVLDGVYPILTTPRRNPHDSDGLAAACRHNPVYLSEIV